MKKLRSLLIILMAVLVLTGCGSKSSDSSNSKKEDNKKTEIKDKDNKKDDKKDNKKDDKKDDNKKDDDKKDDNKKDDNKKTTNTDKTLVCSLNEEGQEIEMTIGWKNDEINTIGVDVTMDVSSYGVDDSTFDLVASYLDEAMKESLGVDENTEGIDLTSTVNKDTKTINIVMIIDLTKVSPEVVENLNLNFTEEDLKSSYDDLKQQAEASGYTCR